MGQGIGSAAPAANATQNTNQPGMTSKGGAPVTQQQMQGMTSKGGAQPVGFNSLPQRPPMGMGGQMPPPQQGGMGGMGGQMLPQPGRSLSDIEAIIRGAAQQGGMGGQMPSQPGMTPKGFNAPMPPQGGMGGPMPPQQPQFGMGGKGAGRMQQIQAQEEQRRAQEAYQRMVLDQQRAVMMQNMNRNRGPFG
jgi:hypothetical protein